MFKAFKVGMRISYNLDTEIQKEKSYEELRKYLGEVFKELARQKEGEVMDGHLMSAHIFLYSSDVGLSNFMRRLLP